MRQSIVSPQKNHLFLLCYQFMPIITSTTLIIRLYPPVNCQLSPLSFPSRSPSLSNRQYYKVCEAHVSRSEIYPHSTYLRSVKEPLFGYRSGNRKRIPHRKSGRHEINLNQPLKRDLILLFLGFLAPDLDLLRLGFLCGINAVLGISCSLYIQYSQICNSDYYLPTYP